MTMSRTAPSPAAPALIAIDWGTTSMRAFLFAADGSVLESNAHPAGVMNLPRAGGTAAFDAAFESACGAWLDRAPALPVLAAGMVGSAQGWREAPYVNTPVDADALVDGLIRVESSRGVAVAIVPGVLEPGTLPDVMRGEETQIVGALAGDAGLASGAAGALIGLPGTHAKWAWVRDGRIERFRTYMTGELFATLRDHTILGRTMQAGEADPDAFRRGVGVARESRDAGLLATIFSTRTLGLTGQLAPRAQGDYLSGLLIGHELNALVAMLAGVGTTLAAQPPRLIGDGRLCERYLTALREFGCEGAQVVERATERGLWRIASQAGLVGAAARAVS
ncbi:2-dehydro-3-deoxygalactonokinase [Burkholderia glumae]|uniref:2-dehydro-3-deoxygalactonokinase n=1 Tax=Burkholderia glumae TaxID=337 RepID=UPI0003A78F23|nr:2-dehydro-3-deoxygalactonokinase [Burkholderia glumae]MCM2492012.1 2-dehydro-3-deoxygalactonokinase [Burkholderia glumae]MCM2543009.1 2-dehydro-3-deoxygalactonokinase [Burkholderia glumae]MCQ0031135.1 2-dehydro-3-deoxygalactonokinase [Burkholderia glumae]MCQ0034875.1 2-dehydro-3-deoxygalactonokinase [Burkholderia glumae]MCR1766585.1 2-dehydro-3-deoxygalactonokinase [Burkholderia glumae]